MQSLRRLQSVLIVVVVIIGTLALQTHPAFAAVSVGCTSVNQNNTNFSSATYLGFPFSQGETASLTISGGTATGASIVVNGTTVASGGNPSTIFYTFPTTQVYASVRFQTDPSPGSLAAQFMVSCPVTPPAGPASSANCPFTDGRLNSCDAAENAAVYCLPDGSVSVWAIDNTVGRVAFTVGPEELASVPKQPSTNTLIKEGLGARLYRLTSGELQLNRAYPTGNNEYVFIFHDCPGGGAKNNQTSGQQPNPGQANCAASVVVQPGDTLYHIAVTHGTTVAVLMQLNHISNPNLIYVGEVICLPGG